MIRSIKIYFLLVLLNFAIQWVSGSNMFILIRSLSNMDCDKGNEYLFNGIDLFKGSDMTYPASILTISGWIFLRGYENQYYTIFSISEGSNGLISLQYNPITKRIRMNSLSLNSEYPITFLERNLWIFFFSSVEYNSGTSQLIATAFIYIYQMYIIIPMISQPAISSNFQKDQIQINIGLPGNNNNEIPSCSLIQNFVFYWDKQILPTQIGDLKGDISSLSSEILFNFDFFYTKKNNGQLLSSYDNKIKKLNLPKSQYVNNILKKGDIFFTDYVNISESNGFTLSFDIYLDTNTGDGNSQIFSVNFINGDQIQFLVNELTTITIHEIFVGSSSNTLFGYFQQSKWFNVILILRSGYQDKSYILINSQDFTPSVIVLSGQYTSSIAQFKFGIFSAKRDIKLNNILFIKGSNFESINNCEYSVMNKKAHQECIICKNLYTNDMENGMTCLDSSTVIQSDDGYQKKYWANRDECGKDMFKKSTSCSCGDQFYELAGVCNRCPYICDRCVQGVACVKLGAFRQINGNCPLNKFDDGFQCLQQLLYGSQKIKMIKFSYYNSNFICNQSIDSSVQYTFTHDQFRYQNQQPILFTFTFEITNLSQIKGVISVVSDINNGEILTIIYDNLSINLFLKGNLAIKIKINPNEPFTTGIWTDWQKAIIFIQTNSQILSKEAVFSLGLPIQDLKICVGPCKSSIIANYLCGILKDNLKIIYYIPYTFIQPNLANGFITKYQQYPQYNDIIGQILAKDQIRLALFQIKETILSPTEYLFYNNDNNLTFQSTIFLIDEEKGFLLQSLIYALVDLSSKLQFPFTISMYIQFEQVEFSSVFLSYQINGFFIRYQFFPLDNGTALGVRICVDQVCKDTSYVKLYLQQPNHIMIIPRNKSPFSSDIFLIQFEIVCNYMRESLNFVQRFLSISPISQITLFQNNFISNMKLYLNKIRIYTGEGAVSFNTDNSDNCFIYGNLEQTNCIFPKRGYLTLEVNPFTHEDIAISPEDCIKQNELQSSGVYTYKIIRYLNECQIICKHPYTDYSKQCQCIDGYLSKLTEDGQTICGKCDEKCQTCKGTKDNCLSCTVQHLSTPNCICTQSNTYLDSSKNECQQCLDKCSSCVNSQDNCLTCSENRINPPQCDCDLRYYKPDGDKCIKIICSDKCEKCEGTPDNCLQCKQNRQSPPNCFCEDNYQENPLEGCVLCPQFTYLESQSNSCLPCEKPCLECYKNKNICTSCIDGFLYTKNDCLCPNGIPGIKQENGEIECIKDMDLEVYLDSKGNYYEFTIIFSQQIQTISELQLGNYEEIVDLYIPQINKKYYSLSDFTFNKQEISFKLLVKSNFVATQAIFTILQTSVFQSVDEKSVLLSKYKNLPFSFNIGPNIFTEDAMSNKNMDDALNFLKNQNSEELKILQQMQVVLYLLNTVQPSSLFLLLQAQLPPNLYKFCQIFSLLIFPSVSDYQSLKIQEEYKLFGLDLNKQEIYPDCQFVYSRLGFSNSLLINIPIIVIKYFVIFLLLGIINIARLLCFNEQNNTTLNKIKIILLQRLNTENEINLLLTTLSILLQFRCIDQDSYASRYGLYLAIGFLVYLISITIFNFRMINQNNSLSQPVKYQQQDDYHVYSILLTDRILPSESNIYKKNYFLMQLLKKYLQILILFIFYPFPYIASPLCGLLLFSSSVATMILKPYKNIRTRIIKIAGELLLSICWFLCLFFPKIENQFNKNNVISDELFNEYMKIGTIVIYLIIGFNGLFTIELIFSTISTISNLFKKEFKPIQYPKLLPKKQIKK